VDLVAGDAEQVQHGIQVGQAQRGIRRVADDGLGIERDPEPGRGDHVQVIGAVADRNGLAERDAGVTGEPAQRLGLARAVDDRAGHPSGQLARGHLEHVGRHVVDAEPGGERVDDLGEAAADDSAPVAEPLQGPDQGPGPRCEPKFLPDLVQHPLVQPGQQGDPFAQGRLEVQVAAHGRRGDLGHLRGAPGPRGQQVDDLVADERRVDVHDDEPHRAPAQAAPLDGHVDLLLGRLAGPRHPQRRRVRAGDVHLDAGHGVLRQPGDPVDVGPAGRDPARHGGDGRG
jgi:hypothetical protein